MASSLNKHLQRDWQEHFVIEMDMDMEMFGLWNYGKNTAGSKTNKNTKKVRYTSHTSALIFHTVTKFCVVTFLHSYIVLIAIVF